MKIDGTNVKPCMRSMFTGGNGLNVRVVFHPRDTRTWIQGSGLADPAMGYPHFSVPWDGPMATSQPWGAAAYEMMAPLVGRKHGAIGQP
jgi:hypothetical protein